MEFFHAHTRGFHARISKTLLCDALCQSLGEIDVTARHDVTDILRDRFIVDDPFELVLDDSYVFHREIDIDANRLMLAALVPVNADIREHL